MSGLVEKVAKLICESVGPEGSSNVQSPMGDWPAWQDWTPQARAAIAAVAEWLDEHQQLDKDRLVHCALVWQYTAKSAPTPPEVK